MTDLKELAEKMAATGYRPDTYPDYWKCRICSMKEPHVHRRFKQTSEYGGEMWDEDHGYDIRDEEPT